MATLLIKFMLAKLYQVRGRLRVESQTVSSAMLGSTQISTFGLSQFPVQSPMVSDLDCNMAGILQGASSAAAHEDTATHANWHATIRHIPDALFQPVHMMSETTCQALLESG